MSGEYGSAGGSAAGGEPGRGSRSASGANLDLDGLGRITGELLHDLGGILAVLSGRVSLAREEAALGRIPAEELARIQGDTDELRRMVIDILEELKNRPRSLEVTFPVAATLDETVNRWLVGAPAVNTTLRSTLSPRAEIAGPRTFFTRAFGNLLRNAARHARSEIRVTLRPNTEADSVQIRVEDDGSGVSSRIRERVFDPLVSAAESGTGLGLSFARWGIERLNGSLRLLDEPADLGGAAFLAELPLATLPRRKPHTVRTSPDTAQTPAETGPRARDTLAGLRVAIVDDDRAVRRTLARLVDRSGAEAIALDPSDWSSVEDSVRELAAGDPDVVILDVNLGRISGSDIERALSRDHPHLAERVLFVTGGPIPDDPGDRPILSKVIGWDQLASRIRSVAGRS